MTGANAATRMKIAVMIKPMTLKGLVKMPWIRFYHCGPTVLFSQFSLGKGNSVALLDASFSGWREVGSDIRIFPSRPVECVDR